MFKPEFLLASLIVVLIPGTGVVYTITTGLTLKWRASLAAALGWPFLDADDFWMPEKLTAQTL